METCCNYSFAKFLLFDPQTLLTLRRKFLNFILDLRAKRKKSTNFYFQEEIAAGNLSKARKLQADVEEAEERADMAEQMVAKLRSKLRS